MTVYGSAEGYLEDKPVFRVTQSGLQLAEGWLLVQSGTGKYVRIDRWWYVYWGQKAEEFERVARKGQRVVMHGEIGLNDRSESYAVPTGKITVKTVSVASPVEMDVDQWRPKVRQSSETPAPTAPPALEDVPF